MQSERVLGRKGRERDGDGDGHRQREKRQGRGRASSSQSSAVTARATCFNLPPLRAAKCVYKPTDCVLACVLPPRISVRASLSAPLLQSHRERQRARQRETRCGGKRLEKQGFSPADHTRTNSRTPLFLKFEIIELQVGNH